MPLPPVLGVTVPREGVGLQGTGEATETASAAASCRNGVGVGTPARFVNKWLAQRASKPPQVKESRLTIEPTNISATAVLAPHGDPQEQPPQVTDEQLKL